MLSRDSIRAALGVNGHDSNSFNPALEPTVSYIADCIQKAHAIAGLSIVLDETHTHPANLEKQMDFFCKLGYDVHVWAFSTPRPVCMQARPLIGVAVYNRMQAQMQDSYVSLNSYVAMKLVTVHTVSR